MRKNVFLAMALLTFIVAVLSAQTDSGGTPDLKYTLPKGAKGYSVDKGKVKSGAVVIPDSYNNMPVTAIAKKAFSTSAITSITIPNSVTEIGDEAFKGCKNLTNIIIPDSVITMGKNVFDGCGGLTGVIIGNSVIKIEKQAFNDCIGLTEITIPDSVTVIEEQAFKGCTGLTGITIGNGVTGIGKQAFKGCKSLVSVTIPNGVTVIDEGTFDSCASLTNVTIPNGVTTIKGNPLIGGGAFNGCKSLTGITIPNSVTVIGNAAFSDTGLTSVTIPNSVTKIELNSFANCKNLTAINFDAGNSAYISENGVWFNKNKTVLLRYPEGKTGAYTVPNGVTSIGDGAFNGCKGLTDITIPNTVTNIGSYAFQYCSGLTSITIPNSVNSFGQHAFYSPLNQTLTSVTFQGPIINERYKLGDYGFSPFYGDLREKFLTWGPGTYTRPSNSDVWTRR